MSNTEALRKALAQALAALATCNSNDGDDPWFDHEKVYAAREAARAALVAKPAGSGEPVAWHMRVIGCDGSADWCELGAAPPEPVHGVEALPLVYATAQPAASGEPVAIRLDFVKSESRWNGEQVRTTYRMLSDKAGPLTLYATAQPAPARVPPGWQLVPVEPTPEMLEALKPFPHHLTAEHPDPADPWHRQMAAAVRADQMCAASEYRQMLAAAPTAPPVNQSLTTAAQPSESNPQR